jgi:hypothetical protein
VGDTGTVSALRRRTVIDAAHRNFRKIVLMFSGTSAILSVDGGTHVKWPN